MIIYACLTDSLYRPNDFHRYIAKILHAALDARHARIIFQAPPQHGKSTLVSQILTAYVLGRFPEWPIIGASYGEELIDKNGEETRRRVSSSMHKLIFPKSIISPTTRGKTNFDTTARGKYFGATIGGAGSGFSSKLFIIDDPFKSRIDADSKARRDEVWSWYQSVVIPRLDEHTVLVIMHTRWSDDDLVARVQKHHKHEKFQVIDLPALARENDEMGREIGDPLVPQRFSAATLKSKKMSVGPRDWAALYMQRPISDNERLFRRADLRYHELKLEDTRHMNRYLICDSSSGKKGRDYTAMGVIGLHSDNNAYVLEVYRARLNLADRCNLFMDLHRRWQPFESGYEQFGMMADIEYIQELQERQNYRFNVVPLAGALTGSSRKESRIERLIPLMRSHRFYLPKVVWRTEEDGMPRNLIDEIVEQEMLPFPTGANDDAIDMFSRLFDFNPVWPKLRQGAEDTPLTHLENLHQRTRSAGQRPASLNRRGARGH